MGKNENLPLCRSVLGKETKIFSEVVRVVYTERLMCQYSDFLTALDSCVL